MFEPYRYERPTTVGGAVDLLRQPGAVALAGGTDLLLQMRLRNARPAVVVDLKEIAELQGITVEDGRVRIGALTTVSDILRSEELPSPLAAVADAARVFACHEIRNRATIGGNLANASPGAEFSVPLMALDADVIVRGTTRRTQPLGEFLQGPGRTTLEPGELIEAILVTGVAGDLRSAYLRRARTRGMDLASVSLAAVVRHAADPARRTVALSMGAVAGVPPRPAAAEALLRERILTPEIVAEAGRSLVAEIAPRASSLRATPDYKRAVLPVLLRRVLDDLGVVS